MEWQTLTCGHCGGVNAVSVCRCGRSFVLTVAHLEGRQRGVDEQPIQRVPSNVDVPDCDFCAAKARNDDPRRALNLGLRQRTCPVCHQEFLSEHGR